MQMNLLDTSDKTDNQNVATQSRWPQYYIGAYPYCYQIPAYTGSYPPPIGALQMGQSPGTHWYHAHKHGSTAIDVANGMVGAFIIEGKYDEDLDGFYGTGWARRQRVMVINQPGTSPNRMLGGGGQDKGPDFVGQRALPADASTWRRARCRCGASSTARGRSGALLSGFPPGFRLAPDRPGRRPVRRQELPEQRGPADPARIRATAPISW